MSRLTGFLAVFFLSLASLLAQRPTHPTDNTITIAQRLGYPPTSRLLIIHADDFGMMHTVDTATEEAFDNHWITSASILVPCPWFPEVAQWAKSHPDADLGIHLALNADWTSYRWSPVSPQPQDSSLLDPDGYLPLTTSYVVAHAKPADVETEVHAQIDKALAAGIHISHLDTHMGTIVSSPGLTNVYLAASKSYKLPALLARDSRLHALPAFPPDGIVLDAVLGLGPASRRPNGSTHTRKFSSLLLRVPINSSCISPIMTPRSRARLSIILTGVPNGARTTSTSSKAPSSKSSSKTRASSWSHGKTSPKPPPRSPSRGYGPLSACPRHGRRFRVSPLCGPRCLQ